MSEPITAVGHERKDANVRVILWGAASLVMAAIVIHFGVGLFQKSLSQRYHAPDALNRTSQPQENVPPPRLQVAPEQEWENYRSASELHLHSYGWVDRKSGVIRVPIERAMELTVQRGLPVRPQPKPEPAP